MRREELTCASRAGGCGGRAGPDEDTCGDQSRGGRQISVVSHGTPFGEINEARRAARLPGEPSPAKVAKENQHDNDDDDDPKNRHVLLSGRSVPTLRQSRAVSATCAAYAASGTARDRAKARCYVESAIVRRCRRPSAESRANASPPFPRLESVVSRERPDLANRPGEGIGRLAGEENGEPKGGFCGSQSS
jgi:hypothetical protein